MNPRLLVWRWERTWRTKLALAAAAVVALILFTASLPHYGNPGVGTDGLLVTQHGLLYANPLARMFEFVFGMCIALAWRRRGDIALGPRTATALELGTVALCVLSMAYLTSIGTWGLASLKGTPISQWLAQSGSVFAFGALIYVMARGEGHVSALLASPMLVFLGEISYSTYLLHQILLSIYGANAAALTGIPNAAAFCIFLVVLLLASYVMWAWVEMPGRRLILGRLPIHSTPGMRRSWRALGLPRPLLATVALGAVLASLRMTASGDANLSQHAPTPAETTRRSVATNANFGGKFALDRLDLLCGHDQLRLEMAWRRTTGDTPPYTIAVHLTDGSGAILDKFDFRSSGQARRPDAGHAWADALAIPTVRISPAATTLAVGMYDDTMQLLAVDHEPTDWGGRRMLVPLAACAVTAAPAPGLPPAPRNPP